VAIAGLNHPGYAGRALVAALFQNLLDFLTGSEWTYLILFGICLGDAVFPALPSETALIVCGIQAGRGQLSLGLVIAVGAAGAFLGDNTSYGLGRFVGKPIQERLFAGEKAQRRLDWAKSFLKERGGYLFLVARFIPGGRTAATFTAGLVHYRWLMRFVPFVAIAAILWSTFGTLVGYFGGRVFEEQPLYALLLAFGIAAAITVAAEAFRRTRGSE
jgi:membrane protein DedA with SNARE-associated domain